MVEVYSVTVDCTEASRFARTVMTSKALKNANTFREIFVEVELPKTALISNFSMSVTAQLWWLCLPPGLVVLHVFVPHREIDGRAYLGEVKKNDKAKQQYETAVSMGKTAGLVKYAGIESAVDDRAVAEASLNAWHFCPGRASGRKMEKFSVSVNIAANSTVAFVLTYEKLLQRKMGQYEILTRVTPKQPVQEFQVWTTGFHFTTAGSVLMKLTSVSGTDCGRHLWGPGSGCHSSPMNRSPLWRKLLHKGEGLERGPWRFCG